MKKWKGNGNTTTLLLSLKGLEILHKKRRGQVKTIVMEHFNGILFHKSGLANKQHTNQSHIQFSYWYCLFQDTNMKILSKLTTTKLLVHCVKNG
jgi:hypothetical protein